MARRNFLSHRLSYIVVLLGAVLWGTTGTAQTFIPQTIHPLAVGALRLAIGGFSLLFILLSMRKVKVRNWPWVAIFFAAVSMAIFQYLFFSSVRLTGVAIGTVVAIGSAPIFSGLIEWLFLKRPPTRVWMMATVFTIIGCVMLFLNKEDLIIQPIGVVMSLGAGFLFAFYTLVNKKVLDKVEVIPAVAVIFSMSAVMLLPFLFLFETEGILTRSGVVGLVYLGIAATSIAYIFFTMGLQRIPSSSAVTLSLAEPLTASILSVLVVGEKLNGTSWVGILLLFGGILVLTFSRNKEDPIR